MNSHDKGIEYNVNTETDSAVSPQKMDDTSHKTIQPELVVNKYLYCLFALMIDILRQNKYFEIFSRGLCSLL